MNRLYTCVFMVLFTHSTLFAQIKLDKSVEVLNIEELYSPRDFKILTDSTLIVIDDSGENPVYLVNFITGQTLKRIRYGKGPGELTWRYKNISLTDNQLMIWDSGLNSGSIYDHELNFKGQLVGSVLEQQLYQIGFINDTTVYYVDNTQSVINLANIENYTVTKTSKTLTIDSDIHKNLAALSNVLLKQTFLFHSTSDRLFWGFEYSSYGYTLNLTGKVIVFSDPNRVELPNSRSNYFILPDIAEHPVGMLDIDELDGSILALYQGRTVTKQELLKHITDFSPLINQIYHSTKVNVFNSYNGVFVETKLAPLPVRKIEIHNGEVFGLNTLGDEPKIYKFKLK